MAPRSTVRRLAVAVPAAALVAVAATACHPPNEKPSDSDAGYTLPSYSEASTPAGHEGHAGEAKSGESKPGESKPGETRPMESKPVETPAAQHTGMVQPPA